MFPPSLHKNNGQCWRNIHTQNIYILALKKISRKENFRLHTLPYNLKSEKGKNGLIFQVIGLWTGQTEQKRITLLAQTIMQWVLYIYFTIMSTVSCFCELK